MREKTTNFLTLATIHRKLRPVKQKANTELGAN